MARKGPEIKTKALEINGQIVYVPITCRVKGSLSISSTVDPNTQKTVVRCDVQCSLGCPLRFGRVRSNQ